MLRQTSAAVVVLPTPTARARAVDPIFVPGYLRAELDAHVIFTLALPCSKGDVGVDMVAHKTAVMRRKDGTPMYGDAPDTVVFRLEGALRMQCPGEVRP